MSNNITTKLVDQFIVRKNANRMSLLGTEMAFEVLAKAKQLEREGKNIIHLEIGEPDFPTPSHIVNTAIKALENGEHHYTPAPGLYETRQAIADHITRTRNVKTNAEDIVITPGAKPIMFYAIMCCIDHGDEVIIPSPGYPIYESMVNFVGGKSVALKLSEETKFRFHRNDLERLISKRTKMIIINSPHNPTGGILTKTELKWIAEIAIKHNLLILSDEIYDSIIYDDQKHESIYSLPGLKERTILLAGHSKNYAMTGWRLGYGVLPKELVPLISQLIINSVACVPPFVQLAGISALDPNMQGPTKKMVSIWKERRDYMVKELNNMGLKTLPPAGAFYIFSNISNVGVPSRALGDYLLYECGVAVLDGAYFGEYGNGYIRLSSATSMEIIKEGLKRIRYGLEQIKQHGIPSKYLRKDTLNAQATLEWITHNANGKKRVLVTKNLPGSKWLNLLLKHDYRVDVCQSDAIVPQHEILRVMEDGTQCHGIIGQLTEKWDNHMFSHFADCGGIVYSNYAVGYNNVDVDAATKQKILVGNTPGVLTNTTAEMAVALTFSAARNVVEGHSYMVDGRFHGWSPTLLIGKLLYGKTLGIIGMGRIGQAYATMMCQGHHMNIIYYDVMKCEKFENFIFHYSQFLKSQDREPITCTRANNIEEVLRLGDVVSLHTPLNSNTHHLIDALKLSIMKEDAILVNSSRGAIIDEESLVKHCQNHPKFQAALDVFEFEPKMVDGLANLNNVVIVPHLGSATIWTREGMATLAAYNILAILNNWPISNKYSHGELDVSMFVDCSTIVEAAPSIINAKELNYQGKTTSKL